MATGAPDVVLSDLQIALMRVLWARGESSTADVAEVLAQERGIKHTTVATMLTRLEKRGVVKDVVVQESFPVQIRLRAPKAVIDELNQMPRTGGLR